MDLSPVCEAAKPLVHSAPGLRWWLGLNASEQGAWASGIGAFAAAAAAVYVAVWQYVVTRRDRSADKHRRAKLMAIDMVEIVTRLKADINAARRMLPDIEIMLRKQKVERSTVEFIHLDAADALPRGIALDSLPDDVSESMAQLSAMAFAYNAVVRGTYGLEGDISTQMADNLRETFNLGSFLDGLQESLAQTAAILARYAPNILNVDFRSRGES